MNATILSALDLPFGPFDVATKRHLRAWADNYFRTDEVAEEFARFAQDAVSQMHPDDAKAALDRGWPALLDAFDDYVTERLTGRAKS